MEQGDWVYVVVPHVAIPLFLYSESFAFARCFGLLSSLWGSIPVAECVPWET